MKNIFNVVILTATGCLFVAAAFFVLRYGHADEKISRMPDYDYISEIKQLIDKKNYGEAKTLAEDVINLGLPCAQDAEVLKKQADEKLNSRWERIKNSLKVFVTGEPGALPEEIIASMASDMIIYGDIRDLIKQLWFKLTGKETDPVIATLATAGLITEFVDVADWVPAVLKGFRKTKCMTKPVADFIVTSSKKIAKTGKIDAASKAFFKDTKAMVSSAGFIRSKNIFKHINHVDDVALLSKNAVKNPHATHLLVKHYGDDAVDILKKHPDKLSQIARKGKIAARLLKTSYKHRNIIPEYLSNFIRKHKYALTAILFGSGMICLTISGIKIRRFGNKVSEK